MDNRPMEPPQDLLDHRRREFHQDLQLSNEAKRILAEPLIQAFFEKAEEDLMKEWLFSQRDDKELREKLYYFIHLIREFKEFFQDFLDKETYAIQELSAIEDQS